MSVSPSLNTEDFVNRVDQARRLERTTTVSAKQIALYSIIMPNATWALEWDVVAVELTELDL